MTRKARHAAILRLIRERPLSTQSELADALREEGFEAVQTTVSRDIHELGLVKVRAPNGRLVYALPGSEDLARLDELTSALRRWTVSLEPTGNLLVLKTPAGFASPLAEVIDRVAPHEVAGTIAGENTVFIAPRNGLTGADLAQQFRHHLEGDT